DPMLDIQNVSVRYGAIEAITDVSLQVFPGEIVTLIGSNGAGKSTLLMSLFSQPRVYSGRILFQGQQIQDCASHEIAGKKIAFVPEGRRIFPGMSVLDNLWLGAASSMANSQSESNRHILVERM